MTLSYGTQYQTADCRNSGNIATHLEILYFIARPVGLTSVIAIISGLPSNLKFMLLFLCNGVIIAAKDVQRPILCTFQLRLTRVLCNGLLDCLNLGSDGQLRVLCTYLV